MSPLRLTATDALNDEGIQHWSPESAGQALVLPPRRPLNLPVQPVGEVAAPHPYALCGGTDRGVSARAGPVRVRKERRSCTSGS